VDAPASIAFHDGRKTVVFANHALFTGSALPQRFVVLEGFVGEAGAPLFKPAVP
jgi:hypothetical protein